MGRRADHSRADLVDLAATAVGELVTAEGYGGLNMRSVAGKIGYSVGTLYNLFENFDGMVLFVNGRTLDQLDILFAGLEHTGMPETDLDRLLEAYLSFINDRPNLWDLLFEHQAGHAVPLPDWYRLKLDKVMGRLEVALTPLFSNSKRGEFEDSPEQKRSAQVLWAGLHGIWSLARTGKLGMVSSDPADNLSRSLVETYIAGLRAKNAPKRVAAS